jgi:3-hydroxyisobutyrate dehydrogenase
MAYADAMNHSSDNITHVGYVGLGIMGSAMAANLLKAGFKVTVWNRTAAKAQPLVDQGAAQAASLADLARSGVQAICINVSDTPDVEAVLLGDDGLLAHAPAGTIIIDHSTISPTATQTFAQKCADKGVHFLDAPVSGGDVGARNATLSIMVGGDEASFQRCLPVFQAMGKNITHLGPAGMGQTCKACNQIAVSLNLLGVCEAMALAKKSGLDLNKMIQVVSGGAAGSWQLANLGPRIAQGDMAPGFMIDLVLKDLAIVANAADDLNLPLAGTALAQQYFRAVAASGDEAGRQGTQAMSQTLEKLGHFKYSSKNNP